MTIGYGAGDGLTLMGVSLGARSVGERRFAEHGTRLSFGASHAKTIAPAAFTGSKIIWSACLSILGPVFGGV